MNYSEKATAENYVQFADVPSILVQVQEQKELNFFVSVPVKCSNSVATNVKNLRCNNTSVTQIKITAIININD